MKKIIKSRDEVLGDIKNAVRLISEPVIQTLSPNGKNVIYEDSHGGINQTNDGVTIAKQIYSDNPIEQSVIEVIKEAALSTNKEAGDGTTTTTLLSSILIHGGLKLIEDGANPMEIKTVFEEFGNSLLARMRPTIIKSDEQLFDVASISANNDNDIARNVVDVIKTAGEDGLVFIEDGRSAETTLDKYTGFVVDSGLLSPEYAQNQGFTAQFDNCHVLVCDKRIYYEEEAQTILRVAIESGINKLAIIARDFIGKSVNVFSANQIQNENIKLILVKESDENVLRDLSLYLGGALITEKMGKLVNNLKVSDFCVASRVFSTPQRTVLVPIKQKNPELEKLIAALKDEKKKDAENETVRKRLASLTNGMVTVKVGGNTPIETRERIFRYEDAINATRSAMKYGYLLGGGLGLLSAYNENDYPSDYRGIFRKYCEGPLRQIAKNCGQHEDGVLSRVNLKSGIGYDAKNNTFVSMKEAGIIDPFKVIELAVRNSISVANVILTTGWYVVIDKEVNKEDKK